MRRPLGRIGALASAVSLFVGASAAAASSAATVRVVADPVAHGVVHAKGSAPVHSASAKKSPVMTYHGGRILPTVVTKPIFWGPSWTNSTFTGDKISGLDALYEGLSGSNYTKTVDEYTGTNGQVESDFLTYQGHILDTSTAAGGNNTSVILNEVAKQVTAGNIVLNDNSYIPVYVDVPRGNASYCAWHSSGSIGGKLVQFAFFFKLDGDPGCDPSDNLNGHSQGLSALANMTGHEFSEARSDPDSPGAWYNRSGLENGDLCAWTWGGPTATLSNGAKYKLQGEWSNAAYNAGTGYPNTSGQKGCLGGL